MKVMIVGFGHVGRSVLNLALKSTLTNHCEFVVGVRSSARHVAEFNLITLFSMASADAIHAVPHARMVDLDVEQVEQTAETLSKLQPDVVINAASRQAWWYPDLLPAAHKQRLASNPVGPSLPNHLVPAMRLQQALQESGRRPKTFTINAAYPDVVNPVLARCGLGFEVGAGNIANPINAIRAAAALEARVAASDIHVRAWGHHSFSYRVTRQGDPTPAPFHIEFESAQGELLDLEPLAVFRHLPTTFKRTSGLAGTLMTGASVWSVLRAYVDQHGQTVHAPGPQGLEGGYAIKVRGAKVELVSPLTSSLAQVQAINRAGAVLDGIECIEDDGTVVFTPGPMDVIQKVTGYSCQRMALRDAQACSDDWLARFQACRADQADSRAA